MVLFLAAGGQGRAEDPAPAAFAPAASIGVLRSEEIREASGMAASLRHPGFLWVLNDSGAKPEIHLIDTRGRHRGKTTLVGAQNVDWEDLASFQLGGKAYLMAADIGDNESKRDSCILYVLEEPEPPADDARLDQQSRLQWRIRFRYEDGPRDCESAAVDAAGGNILLLSKRTKAPLLYELPLKPESDSAVITARRIGETSVKAPPGVRVLFANQPTGLDLTPDGTMAAVLTYHGVFVFPKKHDESWSEAFSLPAVLLGPHHLRQAEAIAFSDDGSTIYVASEGAPCRMVQFQHRRTTEKR